MTTVVLEAVPAPSGTVRFVDQVVRDAPTDIAFIFFSWKNALTANFDVIHFHWPELLVRHSRPVRTYLNYIMFSVLLLRLRVRRIRVVRTMHNIHPHEQGKAIERFLLRALDNLTSDFVTLNSCTPTGTRRPIYIPHADYREQFGSLPTEAPIGGRLLSVGRIEPYKRIPHLIDVVSSMDSGVDELRIVGRPTGSQSIELAQAQRRYRGSATLTLSLAYVSDEQMVLEVSRAEAVILPYADMHNSGILLVALSLCRPIIVPRSCVNSELSAEVGEGWVIEYDGPLTADSLSESLMLLRGFTRDRLPTLRERDWSAVAERYGDVFRAPRN